MERDTSLGTSPPTSSTISILSAELDSDGRTIKSSRAPSTTPTSSAPTQTSSKHRSEKGAKKRGAKPNLPTQANIGSAQVEPPKKEKPMKKKHKETSGEPDDQERAEDLHSDPEQNEGNITL